MPDGTLPQRAPPRWRWSPSADPVLERGRELLRRTGLGESGARIYADHRELLDRERPELAAVAAESGVHARVALDCLDAGAHVIVEKPIALSLSDADEMIRRAGNGGSASSPAIRTALIRL